MLAFDVYGCELLLTQVVLTIAFVKPGFGLPALILRQKFNTSHEVIDVVDLLRIWLFLSTCGEVGLLFGLNLLLRTCSVVLFVHLQVLDSTELCGRPTLLKDLLRLIIVYYVDLVADD